MTKYGKHYSLGKKGESKHKTRNIINFIKQFQQELDGNMQEEEESTLKLNLQTKDGFYNRCKDISNYISRRKLNILSFA